MSNKEDDDKDDGVSAADSAYLNQILNSRRSSITTMQRRQTVQEIFVIFKGAEWY